MTEHRVFFFSSSSFLLLLLLLPPLFLLLLLPLFLLKKYLTLTFEYPYFEEILKMSPVAQSYLISLKLLEGSC